MEERVNIVYGRSNIKKKVFDLKSQAIAMKPFPNLRKLSILFDANRSDRSNQSVIDPDAIIIGSSGSLPGDLQRMWESKKPNTYHMEYGYSCMGYEISGALGVKMAEPDREVYAMVGDGSYLMLHSELITSFKKD